jgi:beta-N-acetylhexosaminidase
MDTPYLLGKATSAVRLATYSSTRAAMDAAAAVIAGKATARGHSPVVVSGLPRTACAG